MKNRDLITAMGPGPAPFLFALAFILLCSSRRRHTENPEEIVRPDAKPTETLEDKVQPFNENKVLNEIAAEDKRIAYAFPDGIGVLSPSSKYKTPLVFKVGEGVDCLSWDPSGSYIYFTQKTDLGSSQSRYVLRKLNLDNGSCDTLVDSMKQDFTEISSLRIYGARLFFKTRNSRASVKIDGTDLRTESSLKIGDQVVCSKGRHTLVISEDGSIDVHSKSDIYRLNVKGKSAIWENGR